MTATTLTKLPINTDTLLILEKAFDSSHLNQAIENLNVIEQLLIGIVEYVNENNPSLRANFIVRRLPVFTIPLFTKNEYAIVLENLKFTLSSPHSSVSDTASIDGKPVKVTLGHTEIFQQDTPEEPSTSRARKAFWKEDSDNDIVNSSKAYYSHEIFQRFSSAFLKGFESEVKREKKNKEDIGIEKVQLIGPHLLHNVKYYPEVEKIFTLTQSDLVGSSKKKSKVTIQVNHQTSVLILELDGTEVILRPALFLKNGYPKLHNSLLERIPLYHPSILNIGESLAKGCLLFPTNFETLWTIQFWPSESHIIFSFHPNSIIGRIFKLYGSFCLNPANFWEILHSCFVIGVDDARTLQQAVGTQPLSIDFITSSFLHELETLSKITDWEPKNFSTRFTSLLNTAIEAFDKGFHSHYFTKRNVLRSFWRIPRESLGIELESNGIHGLDHADSTRPTSRHHSTPFEESISSNPFEDENIEDHDEFGLHFEELSLNDCDEINEFKGPHPLRRKSTLDSSHESKEVLTTEHQHGRPSRSLSKHIGATLMRRLSMFAGRSPENVQKKNSDGTMMEKSRVNRSMTDIAEGFEGMINQERREQTFRHKIPSHDRPLRESDEVFSSSLAFAETSFSEHQGHDENLSGIDNEGYQVKESIYASILHLLNEISASNYLTNKELITHLDNSRRVLTSQGELIGAWTQVLNEIPKPKHICPHSFSPRQIQSISLVIQTLSKCFGNSVSMHSGPRLPAWEIIGDILRTALHQMRAEVKIGGRDSYKQKRKRTGLSFKSLRSTKSLNERSPKSTRTNLVSKLSFRSGSYDVCKYHTDIGGLDPETEAALAMEDPETAATHRLLEWLWQLRNSEIGRLSHRAKKYIEALYTNSLIQSHFLEQFSEEKVYEGMAIRSAVAVSRIMTDDKYPLHIPLMTASKRGWQWAEMVLSFVAWNHEKRNVMKAQIPLINSRGFVVRDIKMTMPAGPSGGQQTLRRIFSPNEPDTEALNLAFHSELAVPLGMNDFEEPLRPGPFTVPILIFSSMGYFSQWEVVPGKIVHALVRLQKFNVLQHIATMLLPPHRKTALNEVRKLNKSLAFSAFQFDDNVMTKTFKRLASLRHTRRFFSSISCRENTFSCEEVGCNNSIRANTTLCHHKGRNIECTKL